MEQNTPVLCQQKCQSNYCRLGTHTKRRKKESVCEIVSNGGEAPRCSATVSIRLQQPRVLYVKSFSTRPWNLQADDLVSHQATRASVRSFGDADGVGPKALGGVEVRVKWVPKPNCPCSYGLYMFQRFEQERVFTGVGITIFCHKYNVVVWH